MVRVWLRPCAAAIKAASCQAVTGARVQAPRALLAHSGSNSSPLLAGVRSLSSKGKDKKVVEKKRLSDRFEDDDDLSELPDEVKFLSQELDDEVFDLDDDEDDEDLDLDDLDLEDFDIEDDEDDEDEDDEDAQEWAEKFEREVAEWDDEDDVRDPYEDVEDGGFVNEKGEYVNADGEIETLHELSDTPLEDDRLYIEMPGYDASLSLAESNLGMDEEGEVKEKYMRDPFRNWDNGDAVSPEMFNWMLPAEKRQPFRQAAAKPWKYFVKADHQDIVELALDVELLRLFISPTGRIRPRRFTGLTAKQQRKLAQAVKISRQLALLPYLSRYPEPTPEQWKAMEEEDMAKALAEMADSDGNDDDDDDDEEFDDDMEYQ